MENNVRYSLWLCPEPNASKQLQTVINKTAVKYSALRFEPHITVCSGIFLNADKLESTVSCIARQHKPIFLRGSKFSFRETLYQSLFIEIICDTSLERLHEASVTALELPLSTDFFPHISLAYLDPDSFNPTAEIALLNKQLLKEHCFDRLVLMETSGEQHEWTKILEIKINGR